MSRFNQRSATGAKAVNARARSKFKVDASEVRAKYAALETEIRLLRELRSQVSSSSRSKCRRRLAGHVASKRCFEVLVTKFRRRNFATPRNRFPVPQERLRDSRATIDRSARPQNPGVSELRAAQSPARPYSISLNWKSEAASSRRSMSAIGVKRT
jgi:hypothetical protein